MGRRAPLASSIPPNLGYRKGQKTGVWVVRRRIGKRYVVETIAGADDLCPADGAGVLDFEQAREKARALADGAGATTPTSACDPAAPVTVTGALAAYLDFLAAHRKSAATARNRAANDILPQLGERRVDELTASVLRDWLTALAARPRHCRGKKGQPSRPLGAAATSDEDQRRRKSTANRTLTVLKAALNHASNEGLLGDDASDAAWRKVKPFREADAPACAT